MIRTRVIVGTLLAAAAAGVLVGDVRLAPWFPCLFACLAAAALLAGRELVRLFPPVFRPPEALVLAGVFAALAANWYDVVRGEVAPQLPAAASPWVPVAFVLAGVLLAAFLAEMYRYRQPGAAVPRLALAVFAVAYLGLLGGFFARLRWLDHGAVLLALTIFVPKCGDIGAFFTGTFLGRHKMTPVLSPKKTWEGFAGGLVASVLAAVGLSFAGPVFAGGLVEAAAFGVVVGTAGVLGDLAESIIKRDCQTKDAAKSIPGFGGVLDVIDSVLFAAPVAYVWFTI
ncbi:MAG: phosphatidate cytidylyltransferase [Gemmataceae bacterium]|nr:phosphatidate cytidylyltransferase [Gemmataceae bacterium]